MSDYLKHLAARSLNRTPSIQPRLASRFEPLSPAAGATLSPPASEPTLDRDQLDIENDTGRVSPPEAHAPARAESQPRIADAPPRSLDAAPPSLDASMRSDARTEIQPRVDTEQTHAASSMKPPRQPPPSSVFAPPSGRQPAPHTSSPATTETLRDAREHAAEDARAGLPHKDDTPAPRRPPATNESALERNIRRVVAREFEARAAETEADGTPPSRARAGDRRRQGAEPISIVAARADAVQAAAREQADASAQTAPPIIRVTIGRIEVRAVTPPAPPAARGEARPTEAEARPDPARSLREYLKQRGGGRP
jgi:hypothetical protein